MRRRDFLKFSSMTAVVWASSGPYQRLKPRGGSAKECNACRSCETVGRWLDGGTLEANGVHGAMMPSGLVLLFGYNHKDDFYNEEAGFQLWDPATRMPAGGMQSFEGYNPFCGGQSFLGDGRLFVAGGYKSGDPFRASSADQVRVVAASGTSVTWQSGFAKMENKRWYPTCVTLASGNSFIIGGSAPFVSDNWKDTDEDFEFFDLSQNRLIRHDATGKKLPEDGDFNWPPGDNRQHVADGKRLAGLYPLAHLVPNSKGDDAPEGLLFVLTESFVRLYNPATNTMILPKQDAVGFRTWWTQASSVLLPIDIDGSGNGPKQVRIMIVGGGSLGKGDGSQAALQTADIWVYGVGNRTLAFEQSIKLKRPRFMGDSVLLPDGKILLVGGASTGYANDNSNRISTAELIQLPVGATAGFSTDLANASDQRGYHATALLLPDAAVMVTGGTGHWETELLSSYPPEEHKTVEVFEPPYFSAGDRPQILQAPSVLRIGDVFSVTTNCLEIKDQVVLIRCGARTHSLDTDQRLLRLAATKVVDRRKNTVTLKAHMPNSPTLAPPGPYFLFVLRTCANTDPAILVPSVAQIFSVQHALPADVMVARFRITILTGDDDLRGGNDNAFGFFEVSGAATPEFALNNGAHWDNHTTHSVETTLAQPVSLQHLDHFGIRTTFGGGIGGDNWNIDGLTVEFFNANNMFQQIIHSTGSPLVRLTGDFHKWTIALI